MRRVCVVGGGNGAFATAGDLALKGCKVNLLELPEFESSITAIANHGGIHVEAVKSAGVPTGFAELNKITTDPRQALSDVDLVLVIVPSFGLMKMAKLCIPFLQAGQTVVLSPGNLMSLMWSRRQTDLGVSDITLGEATCMIYSARKTTPTKVFIRGYKKSMYLAAYPATENDRLLRDVQSVYPDVSGASNVIEASLCNVNPIYHPAIVLLNMGRIENTGGDFLLYREGSTASVARIMEEIDAERLHIAEAFAIALQSIGKLTRSWYEHQGHINGTSILDVHQQAVPYSYSKAPSTLTSRHITEDIPYGLLVWQQLGKIGGIKTPTISSLIHLSCLATGIDLDKERTPVECAGWLTKKLPEIIEEVTHGP